MSRTTGQFRYQVHVYLLVVMFFSNFIIFLTVVAMKMNGLRRELIGNPNTVAQITKSVGYVALNMAEI